jgi:hypothetical protein
LTRRVQGVNATVRPEPVHDRHRDFDRPARGHRKRQVVGHPPGRLPLGGRAPIGSGGAGEQVEPDVGSGRDGDLLDPEAFQECAPAGRLWCVMAEGEEVESGDAV